MNNKFCHACGAQILELAEICPKCGVRQHGLVPISSVTPGASDKKILPAFLLAFFCGPLGIHRFYVGKTGSGLAMLLISFTVIGLLVTAIWTLIDWILIVVGSFTDSEGRPLKDWT